MIDGDKIEVCFEVSDTGIGFDVSEIENLFNPFVQADSSYSRKFGGAGLGLAICRKLSDLMGGKIEVESEEGKGSRFRLILPLDLIRKATKRSRQGADGVHPLNDSSLAGKKILVAEDNQENWQLIQSIVKMSGGEATLARDGSEALKFLGAAEYDAILMDLSMPRMDGLTACRHIRNDDGLANDLPIIGVSAHAGENDKQRGIEAGMDSYLTKPVKPEEVVAKIVSAIDKRVER